jgi:hypothetical protein
MEQACDKCGKTVSGVVGVKYPRINSILRFSYYKLY